MNWTLVNTSAWLNVSPTNGTLTPGGSATTVTVTASLNSAASNLVAGSYATTIWFTNLNDSFGQSRQLTLDIVTLPVITAQPTNQTVPVGSTVIFTVGTATNALLFYQWQESGTNLTDGGIVSGSGTATLTLANVTTGTAGTYSVIVSNAAGATPSAGRGAHGYVVAACDYPATGQSDSIAGSNCDFFRGCRGKCPVDLSMARERNEFDRWRQYFGFGHEQLNHQQRLAC